MADRVASRLLDPALVRYGPDGLVAAIAQDVRDGRVLMVAWQDAAALEATLRTGEAHFHSRSRGSLWRKGESSGNTLRVLEAQLDCDTDAVLLLVEPAGPACHTGARSCFDTEPAADVPAPVVTGEARAASTAEQGFEWLERLWATIADRAGARPEGSYTARLVEGGVDAVARKVAEEAIEVVMAAKDDAAAGAGATERAALASEVADLVYHVLVLCAERAMPPGDALAVLRARHRA